MRKIQKVIIILLFLSLTVFSQAEVLSAEKVGEEIFPEDSTTNEIDTEYELIDEYKEIPDPLESWNRLMFKFNDRFYYLAFKPVARGYNAVVPERVRIALRDFFHNLNVPVRFVNALLQGRIKAAGVEIARFGLNSTVGIAGFFDVAGESPVLKKHDEDLGQTLGLYGFGDGFYIVWPFLGPSSLRDTVGLIGDGFLNPVNYIHDTGLVFGINSYKYLNDNSLLINEYEDLIETSIDPYTGVKDAYFQHRQDQIKK